MASTLLSRVMGGAPPPKEGELATVVKEFLEQMQHVLRRIMIGALGGGAEKKLQFVGEAAREGAARGGARDARAARGTPTTSRSHASAAHEHRLAQRDAWHHHELAQATAHAAARRQAEREAEEWERKAEAARAAAKTGGAARGARRPRRAAARRRVGRLKLARAWAQWRQRWHGVTWRRRAVAGSARRLARPLLARLAHRGGAARGRRTSAPRR